MVGGRTEPGLTALPDGAEGDAPLEFAGVLADQEGEVFLLDEDEIGGQDFLQPVKGAARGPAVGRGEFREPSAGGGKEEQAAGMGEGGQAGKEAERIGEAADEVGGVDEIEGPEGFGEVHGIALMEADAFRGDVVREMGGERFGGVAFAGDVIRELALGLDGFRSLDEGVGVVDGDDFPECFGKLERGAAGGAANIESTGWSDGLRKELLDGADGEVQGADGAVFPREDFVVPAVVEEKVFIDEALGFVEVGHGKMGRWENRKIGK